MKFYEFEAVKMNGQTVSMEEYKGKVIVIVNTASKCGFTPQLKALEELYERYGEQGLVILGFPCNQFARQDPGTNKEISEFCLINYGVSFPMFEKIDVNGENAHPLFQYLKQEAHGTLGNDIKWNFTKFLIDRDGKVVRRFAPKTKPERMEEVIIKLLSVESERKK